MHPGEVLPQEFRVPLKPSAGALAMASEVPRKRIQSIAANGRDDCRTALPLGKALGTSRNSG